MMESTQRPWLFEMVGPRVTSLLIVTLLVTVFRYSWAQEPPTRWADGTTVVLIEGRTVQMGLDDEGCSRELPR